MTSILRDTYVQVHLNAIGTNMDLIQGMVGKDVAVMPVVKANGYGHGAVGIAPTLMAHGATYLAVATLTEALELRQAYAEYPLFILGHTPNRLLPYVVENNITQTIFSLEQATVLNELAREKHTQATVHLKVDTGFHRLGTDNVDELLAICKLPYLKVEGVFSHLALVNDEENLKQVERFNAITAQLEDGGAQFRYKHVCDSISLVDYPEYHMNMVRPGALIYGLRGFHKGHLDVVSSLTFVSHLSQVRPVAAGEGVGYDYLWKAPCDTVIGTVPFGYADGYPRNMRDKGYVTILGVKCPIIGVICMDQCMVDLTQVPHAKEGELAIIYGDGSDNTMSIEEASKLAGTNKNEIVARIAGRPPRIYTE